MVVALPIVALALLSCRAGDVEHGAPPVLDGRAPDPIGLTVGQLLERVGRDGSKATVVNVWASYCKPCREEIPDLVRLHRAYGSKGLVVALVSADSESPPAAIGRYLQSQGVDFPTYVRRQGHDDFVAALPPWTGAIPATFVFDSKGSLRHFWEGRTPYPVLEARVQDVLDSAEAASEG